MLHKSFLFQTVRYIPLLMNHRCKVRIFPVKDEEVLLEKQPKFKGALFVDILSFLHRKDFSLAMVKHWLKWKKIKEMREDQRYLPLRQKFLGPDLATTHFITLRDGKVKFVGNDEWTTLDDIQDKKVPSFFVPGFSVEEVDASGTNLCYEGLANLCNLCRLKKLHLRNCPFIDDWCLGRFHLFAGSLEYLDLSGCEFVTERGICALHTLKKLKTLVINDTPNIQDKELVCLLLQDIIPNCNIIGVNYSDPILMKRIEKYVN